MSARSGWTAGRWTWRPTATSGSTAGTGTDQPHPCGPWNLEGPFRVLLHEEADHGTKGSRGGDRRAAVLRTGLGRRSVAARAGGRARGVGRDGPRQPAAPDARVLAPPRAGRGPSGRPAAPVLRRSRGSGPAPGVERVAG